MSEDSEEILAEGSVSPESPAGLDSDSPFRKTDTPLQGEKFWIIGTGGKRYGPGSKEDLGEWFKDGRIAPDMIVSDESGQRLTARSIFAFQPARQEEEPAPPVLEEADQPEESYWGVQNSEQEKPPSFHEYFHLAEATDPNPDAPGKAELHASAVLSIFGIVIGLFFFPVLLVIQPAALILANRAIKCGHEGAATYRIIAIFGIAAGLLFALTAFVMIGIFHSI